MTEVEERRPFEIEMDAFEEQICRNERRGKCIFYPSRIVADTEFYTPAGGRTATNLFDEAEFTQLAKLHNADGLSRSDRIWVGMAA